MRNPDQPEVLDLDAYFARIGWTGDPRADLATLRSVHRAHMLGIPFENIDAMTGTVPSLALPDLAHKLLHASRGGYCYEQNTVLAAALAALGFTVTPLAARVRVGAKAVRPRTHMLLMVEVPGEPVPYLADCGFGTVSLLEPIPFEEGVEHSRGGWWVRLVTEPHAGVQPLWVLQLAEAGVWSDLYDFTQEPYQQVDFGVANWYVATHPRSPFRTGLVIQRAGIDTHLSLMGLELTERRGDGTSTKRVLADEAELRRVLAEEFGITVPAELRLPV